MEEEAARQYFRAQAREQISGSAHEQCDLHDKWLNFIERNVIRYDLVSGASHDRDFKISARSRTAQDWALSQFKTVSGSSRLRRRSQDISRDPRERYIAYFSMGGRLEFEQFQRTNVSAPGTITLVSAVEPLIHTKLGDNDTIGFAIPREFVDQRLVHAEDVCARPVPMQRGIGNLVKSSLTSLQQDAEVMTDQEFCYAARIVADLVLMTLGGHDDVTSTSRSVRNGNLARVKRIIRERLSDPDLRLSEVADACGISLSYVHNLFRDDGRTAWEYLKAERLQRARRLLQFTSRSSHSVTDVALECGFSNMSQFSTAFRAAFGVPPRDILRRV